MNLSIHRVLGAGLAVAGLTLATACTSDDDDAVTGETLFPVGTFSPPVATASTSAGQPPPATATTTVPPVPTAAPSTTTSVAPVPTTTSAAVCGEPIGDTSSASEAFDAEEGPQTNTGLIGFEAELGDHICFERFVITLQPNPGAPDEGNDPGWLVGYDPDFEVCRDRAGQSPAVPGTHFICVNIGSMLVGPDGGLPEMMRHLQDPDGDLITGAVWIESDDGQSTFLVGLNGEHGFIVRTLDDPYRLYIDVGLENAGEG